MAILDGRLVFLDSGVGGLPYLEWIRAHHPDLPLAYLADTRNFPYGEHSDDAIRWAVNDAAKRLFSLGSPRLLILACNTASVVALENLRTFAPCPVVGTVPALKQAVEHVSEGAVAILATMRTIHSPYLDDLIAKFAPRREIIRVAAGPIVRFVEEYWLDQEERSAQAIWEKSLVLLKNADLRAVVIACTHFLHLFESLSQVLGPKVKLIDSREGVRKRVFSLLAQTSPILTLQEKSRNGLFFVTEENNSVHRYQRFAERHKLQWRGNLPC